MFRIEKFYDYSNVGSKHDTRIKYAEKLINEWIEKDLFKKLGSPRNIYDLMIQLDLRGYLFSFDFLI